VTVDRYTKAVLTVIALALTVIALNPWIHPPQTAAQTVSQRAQWEDPIPVVIVDPSILMPSWGLSPSLANKARVESGGALRISVYR